MQQKQKGHLHLVLIKHTRFPCNLLKSISYKVVHFRQLTPLLFGLRRGGTSQTSFFINFVFIVKPTSNNWCKICCSWFGLTSSHTCRLVARSSFHKTSTHIDNIFILSCSHMIIFVCFSQSIQVKLVLVSWLNNTAIPARSSLSYKKIEEWF